MTPQQRTQAIIKYQQSHAVDSDEMARLIEQAIVAAVEQERKACAKILLRVYSAWVEGGYSPGEAFESAREKILHGARSNASTRSDEPAEK